MAHLGNLRGGASASTDSPAFASALHGGCLLLLDGERGREWPDTVCLRHTAADDTRLRHEISDYGHRLGTVRGGLPFPHCDRIRREHPAGPSARQPIY